MDILMVGGLVPWHPQSGGGQIIAYKTGEALSKKGLSVDYVAFAPRGQRREVGWGNLIYELQEPGLLSSVSSALRSVRKRPLDQYDIVHVHAANETVGYCLAYALCRRGASRPRFVMSIYSPRVHAFPRSPGEVITALSCRNADLVFSLSRFS
ncbi:MAG: glycosyltransferase, partial [Anaerolineae bacterium]